MQENIIIGSIPEVATNILENNNVYDEFHNRESYILKVKKDDAYFICNRNSDDFDTIFKDKYVRFWEVDEVWQLNMSDVDLCSILSVLPLDNYKLRHQTILNNIKKRYIDELQLKDIELSNKQMATIRKTYRTIYHEQFKEFLSIKHKIQNLDKKLYEYGKRLFYKNNNESFFDMTYDEIWHYDKLTDDQKVICIILRNYIYNKKYVYKEKYPFIKGKVNKTINMLIKEFNKP